MIKVSVIIPVYNVENYLCECLDSLINQTLKDIEIICINDCSTDGSLSILQKYAAKDERIIVVNNKYNIGAAKSRNTGIQLARGEYVSILDADDFCHLEMLEIAYKNCISKNADLGIYDYAKYNDTTKKIINYLTPLPFVKYSCSNVFNFKEIRDYIFQITSCAPYTKLYKREFLLKSGIKFQDLHNANDTYFGNMILTQAERIIYIDTNSPLYYYRTNIPTQTSNNRNKNPKCTWKAILSIKKSLIKKDILKYCWKSFNSYAVTTLIYSLDSIEDEYRRQLYKFLSYEGLKKLEMDNCNENDFISQYVYNKYRYLCEGDYEKANIKYKVDSVYIDNPKIVMLLKHLEKLDYRYGLWGMGKLGKEFLEVSEKNKFKIECLIDEDSNKIGIQIDDYIIKPFKSFQNDIDAVIITNTHYAKEIYNTIKMTNDKIKLIDADAYYRLGLEIEKCIY